MINKGLEYEEKIRQSLINKGKLTMNDLHDIKNSKNDVGFRRGKDLFYLELKNKTAPDYGSKKIIYEPQTQQWQWNDPDDMTVVFDKFGILSRIKKFTPHKYITPDDQLTEKQKREDMANFENKLGKEDLSGATLLHEYYAKKDCHYIQIEGKGFYHLLKDPADLKVPQFIPAVVFRLRAKPHSSLPIHNYSFRVVITASRRTFGNSEFDLDNPMKFPPI